MTTPSVPVNDTDVVAVSSPCFFLVLGVTESNGISVVIIDIHRNRQGCALWFGTAAATINVPTNEMITINRVFSNGMISGRDINFGAHRAGHSAIVETPAEAKVVGGGISPFERSVAIRINFFIHFDRALWSPI